MGDTLANLQKIFAPKPGLRRIPLPLESYQDQSKPLNSKRLLNLFVEAEPTDSRTETALKPTPGLTQFQSLSPGGPVYGMSSDLPEVVYVIAGGNAWRITRDPVTNAVLNQNIGAVGLVGANYAATIAVGPTAAVICVPPNAFWCGHNPADVLAPIDFSTSACPGGAASVTYVGGYWVYTSFGTASSLFFCSGLLAPTTFNALDFAYADTYPNLVSRAVSLRGDLWIFGEGGIEAWYLAGGAAFPFSLILGSAIKVPTAHPRSIVVADGSLFWLGLDDVVYRSNGYKEQRVSTNAIEAIIHDAAGVGVGAGASSVTAGFSYSQNGHIFYVLSFWAPLTQPNLGGITIAYDCLTKKWADRSSDAGGNGRWRGQYSAIFSDIVLFGDYQSGTIWQAIPSIGSEGGVEALRQVILPPLYGGTHRAFCNRVEIEMEVGGDDPPTSILLEWSDDGGTTFTGARTIAVAGAQGLRQRVYTTRLGSFYQRVFRISARGHWTIYAVDADVAEPGSLSGQTG